MNDYRRKASTMDASSQLPGRVEFDGDHEQSLEDICLASIERNLDEHEEAHWIDTVKGEELEFFTPTPRHGGAVRYLSKRIKEELQRFGAQIDRDIARLQEAVMRSMELEPNGCRNCVPASAAFVASLETHKYGDGACAVSDGAAMCVICKEDFEVGDDLSVLPCKYRHRFHRSCVAKWLALSRFCPVCRHALPADKRAA